MPSNLMYVWRSPDSLDVCVIILARAMLVTIYRARTLYSFLHIFCDFACLFMLFAFAVEPFLDFVKHLRSGSPKRY